MHCKCSCIHCGNKPPNHDDYSGTASK
uniref:Uncharacterized protein n=1 Tax=Arundo donax TaxID=35708 RepID=A0A0A9ETT1_ARUDO